MAGPSGWSPLDNWSDTGLMARLERALTRSGEPVKRKMTMTLEPTDKLDAATTLVAAVNGPEGATLDWHAVDWRACEQNVRRLRQRIFTGLLEPDARKRARPVLRGAGRRNAPGLPGLYASPTQHRRDYRLAAAGYCVPGRASVRARAAQQGTDDDVPAAQKAG
jgi:hypothetical protein